MLKKFAFCDDAQVLVIPHPTSEMEADDAGRQLNTDVLMTMSVEDLVRLQNNVKEVLESEQIQSFNHQVQSLPLKEALWWFIENVPEDSPARSTCFFSLRERIRTEAA